MTKIDLIAAIAAKANLTKKDAAEAVSAFIETVTSELVNWWKITLTWFWTFEVANMPARAWVNPQTWAKIQIPAMNRPKFKAWKTFKEVIRAS